MTQHYYVTDWGTDAGIVADNAPDIYDENRFLSFQAAKLELVARLDRQIDQLATARLRVISLTQDQVDLQKPRPAVYPHRGSTPLLDPEDDMTRREDFNEDDYVSPGSEGLQ